MKIQTLLATAALFAFVGCSKDKPTETGKAEAPAKAAPAAAPAAPAAAGEHPIIAQVGGEAATVFKQRCGTCHGLTGKADDLFEAAPRLARHFMALLAREGTLTMPDVMAHLGLVRPKGVGGAIEPVQRLARLIGAELPFEADFAPSGHKRWTWRSRPLAEVPEETLEPIPAPPPQAKKRKKPKVDRSRYKRAWKRSLEQKKRKGRGADDKRRGGKSKGRRPTAERRTEKPTGTVRDESANVERAARRGPPTAESRRRRYDRPMPEVIRRANRPVARPAARRDEPSVEDGARQIRRQEERPTPAAARPSVPQLGRPASDPPADPGVRRGVTTPEERLPLPRSGVFRRRTVSDTDVPVVVIRRRKR